MWATIILSVLTYTYNNVSFQDRVTTGNFDFAVGDTFRDLSPETQEFFHKSKYYNIDNSHGGAERGAPNTDNCWTFDATCQPDWQHHVYRIPMVEHQGHYYEVTFSYNWRILTITNTYTHSS